ncbi:hypothetical protein J8I26_02150 [Herbaspirillum sp. LeCh32-8]|uniref:hypothetical protein n=1 Tax=Herbaspirillum sp. LeCh32-8 TaxID=2821356 RepID=UPI001AEB9CEA|nr:hypothetical protein [Herbaspirillum sp. LeCh32-8]MBP0596886.1 hypothetical protein [Herbaspirillum sp. LeCh32-8]
MNKATDKYFEALKRLQAAGKKINNDTVAIEAGSKKGSIKSGRPSHEALVQAIDAAAAAAKDARASDPVPGLREDVKGLRQRLDEALEREINLLDELLTVRYERDTLREEVKSLRSGNLQLFSRKSSGKKPHPEAD